MQEYFKYFKSLASQLDGDDSNGLSGQKTKASERVLDVVEVDEKIQLNFASDGLNLNQKISIEKSIHQRFAESFEQIELHVNFKKVKQKPAAPANLDMPAASIKEKVLHLV